MHAVATVDLLFKILGDSSDAKKAFDDVEQAGENTGKKLATLSKVAGAAGTAGAAALASGFAQNLDIGEANAKLAGQLGLSQGDADKAGKVAGAVYASNWGESIDEVNETIRTVSMNLGSVASTSEADLTKMTTSAQILADTFGADVGESAKAAGQLIKNGLAKDATEAFDILGAGFRDGADRSGDFLETISEYSPQFSKLGITGSQALALLEDGLKAGARDTDVIADAFKEFSLRAIDGSKSTSDAYKALGMDAKQTAADIASGGPAANEATAQVLQSLNNIKDPLKQNQVGVALFGTQWEDTLRQILPSMAQWGDASDTVAGSITQIGNTAGGSAKGQIDSMKRSFEQWTQGMASSSGATGLVTTGLLTFGGTALATGAQVGQLVTGISSFSGGAKLASAATKTWSLMQAGLNLVMAANPIALVILAIAALVAGLVVFFTKTETGRRIWAAAMTAMKSAVDTFKNGAAAAWTWITNAWNTMVSKIKSGASGLKSGLSGTFDGLKSGFRSVINFVISGWNRLNFSVPGFSAFGVNVPGFSLGVPKIPMLATGGVVTAPTLAVIGEAGPEAVVPLSQAGSYGLGGGETIQVTVHAGAVGSESYLARVVTEAIETARRRGTLGRA